MTHILIPLPDLLGGCCFESSDKYLGSAEHKRQFLLPAFFLQKPGFLPPYWVNSSGGGSQDSSETYIVQLMLMLMILKYKPI